MASRLVAYLLVMASPVILPAQPALEHAIVPLPEAKFTLDEDIKCLEDAVESGPRK
jgi:hypothetical protein